MSEKDDGGPAANMTLRDHFAAKAIPFMAEFDRIDGAPVTSKSIAEACYEFADAMLEARKR